MAQQQTAFSWCKKQSSDLPTVKEVKLTTITTTHLQMKNYDPCSKKGGFSLVKICILQILDSVHYKTQHVQHKKKGISLGFALQHINSRMCMQ